jgi:serine/threonine-protein kinase
LHQCQALLALEAKLPDVLAGKVPPADQRERLGLLEVCRLQRRHAAAATLYADAFAADPRLADDLEAGHRYNAACAAALAGCGAGKDAGTLQPVDRLALRRQALTWLRAELGSWTRQVAAGEVGRSRLVRTLTSWQKDSDLAGLRDAQALKALPAEERQACRKLWADVADTLASAQRKTAPTKESDGR